MSSGASPPDATLVASVQPLVPAWRVDRTFDYTVPEALAARVQVGSLVRVELGHRKVRGIVTSLDPRPASDALSPILSLVVDVPIAPAPLTELFDWIARRYVVPRGRAFERVAPTRVRLRVAEPEPMGVGPDPKALLSYEGGTALVDSVRNGDSGTWLVRTVPGEDRPTLVAELVAAALASGDGAALVCVPEVK